MSEAGAVRAARGEPKGGSIVADRYRVDRLIARGGMAAVYLAQHVKLNRPVALKVLSPPADAEDPESFEERFKLEAETLASLDHPNIVILHDFGEMEDGRFFLAMEMVDGPRVSDLVKDGPIPVERALNLILQVCAALRYAHKRGVVHRDLKPSNLLVKVKDSGEEVVKVVDFGLVKLTTDDQSITRAGLILGSPHCMAPEQIKGADIDHRADIYATGILIFRLITGAYPFHGPNSAATMIAHMNEATPTFFSVAPELVAPAGLEEVVRRCLEKRPDDRYPDMQVLMNDLAAVMNLPPEQFRTGTATNSTVQRVKSPPSSSMNAVIPILAVGAVAMIGIIALAAVAGIALTAGLGRGAPPAPAPIAAVPSPLPIDTVPVATAPVAPLPPAEPAVDAVPVAAAPVDAVDPIAKAPPKKPNPPPKVEPAKAAPDPTVAPPLKKPDAPEGYMGLPDDFK